MQRETGNKAFREKKQLTRDGRYSPNQSVFFVLMVLLVLMPFLGPNFAHPVHNIQNNSLKNIYNALTAPIITASERTPLASFIPALRRAFIRIAGLTKRSEWDTFFYRQEAYDSIVASFYAATDDSMYHEGFSPFPTILSCPLAGYTSREDSRPHDTNERSRATPLAIRHTAHSPLKLFFFGDSQMHSLASGMVRALGDDKTIKVQELSVPSSGFLRSDYYNWPKKLSDLFTGQKTGEYFDAAALFLGMNDYQDMWTSGGIVLTAGTPEWEDVYRKMVKQHINVVLASVPRLYWFGLPIVRSRSYNQKLQYLNRIHASIAEEYDAQKVVRISLKQLVEPSGQVYVNAIRQEGSGWIPFMQSDGIHYTIEGGEYLMRHFIIRLRHDYNTDP